MKDISTPVPQNEVRTVIKKSLENAALVNYERLSGEARIEGNHRLRPIDTHLALYTMRYNNSAKNRYAEPVHNKIFKIRG